MCLALFHFFLFTEWFLPSKFFKTDHRNKPNVCKFWTAWHCMSKGSVNKTPFQISNDCASCHVNVHWCCDSLTEPAHLKTLQTLQNIGELVKPSSQNHWNAQWDNPLQPTDSPQIVRPSLITPCHPQNCQWLKMTFASMHLPWTKLPLQLFPICVVPSFT